MSNSRDGKRFGDAPFASGHQRGDPRVSLLLHHCVLHLRRLRLRPGRQRLEGLPLHRCEKDISYGPYDIGWQRQITESSGRYLGKLGAPTMLTKDVSERGQSGNWTYGCSSINVVALYTLSWTTTYRSYTELVGPESLEAEELTPSSHYAKRRRHMSILWFLT